MKNKMTIIIFISIILSFSSGANGVHLDISTVFSDSLAQGKIIFVDKNAESGGNGESWQTAFSSLQDAIDEAMPGDQIWVAKGTYYPTKPIDVEDSDPRSVAFQMKNGVAIYGGFSGNEEQDYDLNMRDLEENVTILSGNIGDIDVNNDNSYHVIYNCDLDHTAIMDGFTVNGGFTSNGYGGGMYNINSSPTLTNLIFIRNNARYGGGMHNDNSSPILTGVVFSINGNTLSDGGGMSNYNNSNPRLNDVIFEENVALIGGGMSNRFSSPILNNVTITGNSAEFFGGGIYNRLSSPVLTNVIVTSNYADRDGGGMHNDLQSSLTFNNVTIRENTAGFYGGGIYNGSESNLSLANGSFIGNNAKQGGGIYNVNGSLHLKHVIFEGNTAEHGGGVYSGVNGNLIISNGIFYNNVATYQGGGVFIEDGSPKLINLTFAGNVAGNTGGIFNLEGIPTIKNSIFWNNNKETDFVSLNFETGVTHSLIQNYIGTSETGNITADPMFIDIENGNFRLGAGSAAIDSGTNTPYLSGGVIYGITTDFAGNSRVANKRVDMGAYEYQHYSVNSGIGSGSGTIITQKIDEETILPNAVVEPGTVVTLTASPSSGWRFDRWLINNTTITTSSYALTVITDIEALAYFMPSFSAGSGSAPLRDYRLTMEVEGQGTTMPAPGTHVYRQGTTVGTRVYAEDGWEFSSWQISGKEIKEAETEVRMDSDITIKAIFVEKKTKETDQVIILKIDVGSLQVGGKEALMDAMPYIKDSRTMVPVRFISEILGADVQWLAETRQVLIVLGEKKILLTIGSRTVLLNQVETEIGVEAEIRHSRSFVPLRFISEYLGAKLDWDAENRQITINRVIK